MSRFELELLYKNETGEKPGAAVEYEFEIWRSKGQWIINISDEEKFRIWGNQGMIEVPGPNDDYVIWLEEKLMSLL